MTLALLIDWLRRPWTGWLVALILGLALWVVASRPHSVKKVVEWRERTSTKYVWSTRVVTQPGATVYIQPDGTATLYGPAMYESGGSRETTTDAAGSSRTTTEADPWRGMVTASVLFPRATWEVGLMWHVGGVLWFDVGAGPAVEAPTDSYIPTRYGGVLALTF